MINLFINKFVHKEPHRQRELELCYKNNLKAPFDQIVVVNENQRATYNDFFKATNDYPNDVNVISNLDIWFDESILKASEIKEKECYALSRWETKDKLHAWNKGAVAQRNHLALSQDVWIFRGVVPEFAVYQGRQFSMGVPGCDNILAFLLKHKLKYKVTNPCYEIKCRHEHKIDNTHYLVRMPLIRRDIGMGRVEPEGMLIENRRQTFRKIVK